MELAVSDVVVVAPAMARHIPHSELSDRGTFTSQLS
jgi:hypothetical protein